MNMARMRDRETGQWCMVRMGDVSGHYGVLLGKGEMPDFDEVGPPYLTTKHHVRDLPSRAAQSVTHIAIYHLEEILRRVPYHG